MSDLSRQSVLVETLLEVSSRREIGSDEIATHIRRMRESCPPLLSDDLYGPSVQEWTTLMS